jgi:N-acetyl-1-D-myo-inositol-2-amino-2-deoxy-alpha-D-glucopyranoside deacetylase
VSAADQHPESMAARDRLDPYPPVVVDDDLVDVVVDVRSVLGAKLAALRAHETQIRVEDGWFALSDGVAQRVRDREAYQLAAGPRTAEPGLRLPESVGTDLFAGVRTDG